MWNVNCQHQCWVQTHSIYCCYQFPSFAFSAQFKVRQKQKKKNTRAKFENRIFLAWNSWNRNLPTQHPQNTRAGDTVRKIHVKNKINTQNPIGRPLEIPTGWVLRENHHRLDRNNSFSCMDARRDACYSHQLQTIAHTYLPLKSTYHWNAASHTESYIYIRRVMYIYIYIYMRVRYTRRIGLVWHRHTRCFRR